MESPDWPGVLFIWGNVAAGVLIVLAIGVIALVLRMSKRHIDSATRAAQSEKDLREEARTQTEKLIDHFERIQQDSLANQKETGALLTQNYGHLVDRLGELALKQGWQNSKTVEGFTATQGAQMVKLFLLFTASQKRGGKHEDTERILKEIAEIDVNMGRGPSNNGRGESDELRETVSPVAMP